MAAMTRRVVITGIGAIGGLGLDTDALWQGLCEGASALGPLELFDPAGLRSQQAAQVPTFNAREFVPKHYRKAIKLMARDIQLSIIAAHNAVKHAGLTTRTEPGSEPTLPADRLGCHIGAGLIAAELNELTTALASISTPPDSGAGTPGAAWDIADWGEGMGNLQPLWMLKYLPNMLACHVTILHGAEGPSNTITCSEASGVLCVGESARVVERGDADACFSGGIESKLNGLAMMRYDKLGWLAPIDADGDVQAVCRPYAEDGPGQLMGEGGAIMIVEGADTAAARGASPIAEVLGFGAAHSTRAVGLMRGDIATDASAHEPDTGIEGAIRRALADADTSADQIDAIVPHAMGYGPVDAGESAALEAVFGERLASIPLVTLTPQLGGCAAGQSALQVAVGALCVKHQRLPARLHGGGASEGLDVGPSPSRELPLRRVLVVGSGLGGSCGAVVFGPAS